MTAQSLHTLSTTSATLVSYKAVHSGQDLTIQNLSATSYVYIGGSDVSSANYGYRINPDTAFSVELPAYDEIWAISSVDGSQISKLSFNLE